MQLSKKDEKGEGDADSSPATGIEAADFPILNESKQAKLIRSISPSKSLWTKPRWLKLLKPMRRH